MSGRTGGKEDIRQDTRLWNWNQSQRWTVYNKKHLHEKLINNKPMDGTAQILQRNLCTTSVRNGGKNRNRKVLHSLCVQRKKNCKVICHESYRKQITRPLSQRTHCVTSPHLSLATKAASWVYSIIPCSSSSRKAFKLKIISTSSQNSSRERISLSTSDNKAPWRNKLPLMWSDSSF